MSIAKFIITTAVPFNLARAQNTGMNIVKRTADMTVKEMTGNNELQDRKKVKRLNHLSLMEKLHLRRQQNREASAASRQRQKLHTKCLESQVLDLQVETMKLLLENEELKSHHRCLENENSLLKESLQNCEKLQHEDKEEVKEAFKHAWFVNTPLLKEWVLPQLFVSLLLMLKEIAIPNLLLINAGHFHQWSFPPLLNNLSQFLMRVICGSWKSTFPPMLSPRILI